MLSFSSLFILFLKNLYLAEDLQGRIEMGLIALYKKSREQWSMGKWEKCPYQEKKCSK